MMPGFLYFGVSFARIRARDVRKQNYSIVRTNPQQSLINNDYRKSLFNGCLSKSPVKLNELFPEALNLTKSSAIISYIKYKQNVYEHTILPVFVHAYISA